MARVRFYLDTRPTKDGKCHIKISISHNKTTALMPTGVFVKTDQWNAGDSETDPHVKKDLRWIQGVQHYSVGETRNCTGDGE